MKRTWLFPVIAVVVIIVLCVVLSPFAFTVVPIAQIEQAQANEAFDPVSYVDKIWSSQILTAYEQKAVDLPVILTAIQPDAGGMVKKEALTAVTQQYGLVTVGEANVYMVKATGTIINVDTSKSIGYMDIQLDGYNGPIHVRIYLGPRIPSDETSVRDASGTINFGDFREQTEYGKVATEINKRLTAEVLTPLAKDQLVGKKITFWGAFTIRTFNLINIEVKTINVVPVKIEIH